MTHDAPRTKDRDALADEAERAELAVEATRDPAADNAAALKLRNAQLNETIRKQTEAMGEMSKLATTLRGERDALRTALGTAQKGCGSAITALINRDSNTEGLFEAAAVTAIADAEAGYEAARAALGEAAT